MGKRKGSHAPYFSIPGGGMELGETFEETAIREAKEETGLHIYDPKVINVTNNLRTYKSEGIHYVSVNVLVTNFDGEPQLMEPDKCESWNWYALDNLPKPQFDASEFALDCYKESSFYIQVNNRNSL